MATKARAEIEAAYVMAKKFPRSEEDIRIKVLKTCRIPSFAEKAKYAKPIGNTRIIGPSVRLAEEMLRQWGHIDVETSILFEDSTRRIVQVRAIDLQTGTTNKAQFIVEKTVERKNAKGRIVLSERLNSYGEKIHIVVATEDEIFTKTNAMASKFRRNLILQLIPTYLLEDAMETVDETVKSDAKENPDKAKRMVTDNFSKIGILPKDIEEWLGHALDQIHPEEIAELKTIYTSIRDGETTWAQTMELKNSNKGPGAEKGTMDPNDAKTWDDLEKNIKKGDEETHQPVDKGVKT